jgi:hypothetical protein
MARCFVMTKTYTHFVILSLNLLSAIVIGTEGAMRKHCAPSVVYQNQFNINNTTTLHNYYEQKI